MEIKQATEHAKLQLKEFGYCFLQNTNELTAFLNECRNDKYFKDADFIISFYGLDGFEVEINK